MANQALSIMKLRTLIRFKLEGRTHRVEDHKMIARTMFIDHGNVK